MSEEPDEFDHWLTEEIVCPYCGHEFSDSAEYHLDDFEEAVQCVECWKVFLASAEVSVTYTTVKASDTELRKRRVSRELASARFIERMTRAGLFPLDVGDALVRANKRTCELEIEMEEIANGS